MFLQYVLVAIAANSANSSESDKLFRDSECHEVVVSDSDVHLWQRFIKSWMRIV